MSTPARFSSAQSPSALLTALVASDPGRPRITVYDDTDSPTRGERIELSARVLANWVAKAANLLQEELDAAPGSVVRLDLPPHWRTLYWAFAVWSVGACVEVGPDAGTGPGAAAEPDVLVTDDAQAAADTAAEHVVLVTLAGLARSASSPVPAGAVDEARDLA
ncbi:MAG: TIGR03089 family protein, partial [Ornithinibacter sp.]